MLLKIICLSLLLALGCVALGILMLLDVSKSLKEANKKQEAWENSNYYNEE